LFWLPQIRNVRIGPSPLKQVTKPQIKSPIAGRAQRGASWCQQTRKKRRARVA